MSTTNGIGFKPTLYEKLPKVELHRHLEGSLRLRTIVDIARTYGITIPTLPITAQLRPLVQVQEEDDLTFRNFLSKFTVLRQLYRSPEIIRRVVHEAIEDAAKDGVVYMELRFSPVALTRAEGFAMGEVMDWVCSTAQQASKEFDLKIRLLVTINRHESPDLAAEIAELTFQRKQQGIVGIDLAGNEAEFEAGPFIPILAQAHKKGLKLSIHAGEWAGPDNVRQAIEVLHADRIAHGVRIMEDPTVVALAAKKKTPFEVCLTSNYQSGVVSSLKDHPFQRMLEAGLNVTLNTDDPSISQITLSIEYQKACEALMVSPNILARRILAAGEAAFLPPAERKALKQRLKSGIEAAAIELSQ